MLQRYYSLIGVGEESPSITLLLAPLLETWVDMGVAIALDKLNFR